MGGSVMDNIAEAKFLPCYAIECYILFHVLFN